MTSQKRRKGKKAPKGQTTGPVRKMCSMPRATPRTFGPEIGATRVRAIVQHDKKWLNGTELTYAFMGGPTAQQQAMRKAFAVWTAVGIGISFREITNVHEATVRIAFANDGSWSYVGRDVRTIPPNEPTMNIGWDITQDLDTGVHEIGHTLGLLHEHQSNIAGIVWNEDEVYKRLAGHPNYWDRATTYSNIIAKVDGRKVTGTTWDRNSIMHYPFEAGLISEPKEYRTKPLQPAGGLSALDKQWIRSTYPKLSRKQAAVLSPDVLTSVGANTGETAEFIVRPERTANYDIRTFGRTDAVLALYEKRGKELLYLGGADDSATDTNAHLRKQLRAGSEYVLRLRMMYVEPGSANNVMIW